MLLEINRFTEYLRVTRNFSQHTALAYHADLTQFHEFIIHEFDGLASLSEIKLLQVREWLAHLAESGLSPRSMRRKRSALSRFFKYCMMEGIVRHNPVKGTSVPKIPVRVVQFYDEKTLDNITLPETDDAFAHLRDLLIIELLYGTGMRRAELCSLTQNQIDLAAGQLKVIGKGNKERIIPIHSSLAVLVKEYLALAQQRGFSHQTLLLNDHGAPVNAAFIYRKVKNIMSAQSTLTKNSPHVLRHSYATHLLAGGAELNAVKELLGHSSLAATQVYTHINIGGLLESYRKAHPKS